MYVTEEKTLEETQEKKYLYAWKNERIWRYALKLNSGLFTRYPTNPSVVGPSIKVSGEVNGDMLSYESNYFMSVASEQQKDFYSKLLDENISAAYEYLLTVINSKDKWQEDIKILWEIWSYLDVKATELDTVQKKLIESWNLEKIDKMPVVVKNHLPEHFIDVEFKPQDYSSLIEKVNHTIEKIRGKRNILGEYLSKRRKEMPFLFEKLNTYK